MRLWRAFVALVMFREIDPGIQRHTVQWFAPDVRPISEYEAEEQRILAAAALQPDSLPVVVWSDSHDPDDEDCMCRPCHREALDLFSDKSIKREFDDMVRTDPLLLGLSRTRGRKWTP